MVDREMGVVMLRDETLLTREHGAVYPARLRVVEVSGASYDLDLKLRLTGRVPQMLGAEDFGFGAAASTAIALPAPSVAWSAFAVVHGVQAKPELDARGAYGALLSPTLPPTKERIAITFGDTLPAPAPAHAIWPA